MTEHQDGTKPQLTIVPSQQDCAQGDFPTYNAKIAHIVSMLTSKKLTGEVISTDDFLKLLDPKEDNRAVRDWFADNDHLTKAQFDRALKRIAQLEAVKAELGFVPVNAEDFVQRYAEAKKVTLTPSGELKRVRSFAYGAEVIDMHNKDTSAETKLIYDAANTAGANLDVFGRELRMVNARLKLQFRDSDIADAIAAWQDDIMRKLKVDALLSLQFEKGKATGQLGHDMWAAMEAACFDTSETKPGFAIAVLRKFMWQVKRKARGMTITNHLMPVITGPQGKGKTEFVKAMVRPLAHFKRDVDFNLLTDGKTADIWGNWILFCDEMSHMKKADMDKVKNAITCDFISLRLMKQNSSVSIRNEATLIGCSNNSIGQLIRDDTGGRRFAELVWQTEPDWDAQNRVDWVMLWKSIDENGPDPMHGGEYMELLREQQEENRNQSPTEIWARLASKQYTRWVSGTDLFSSYHEWEEQNFPRHGTNLTQFGRNLTNLIKTTPDFPFAKRRGAGGTVYKAKD